MINFSRFIAVDVETSGLSVRRGGRVIEVGAVAVKDGVIVAELDTLIDTGATIHSGQGWVAIVTILSMGNFRTKKHPTLKKGGRGGFAVTLLQIFKAAFAQPAYRDD